MVKTNATDRKTIFLVCEWIRLQIKRDPVQRRGRGKIVFHHHSCKILYYSTLLKTILFRNKISVPVFYRRIKYMYELSAYELNDESASTSDLNYTHPDECVYFILR